MIGSVIAVLVLLSLYDTRRRVRRESEESDAIFAGYREQVEVHLRGELAQANLPRLPAFSLLEGMALHRVQGGRAEDRRLWVFEFDAGGSDGDRVMQTVVCVADLPDWLPAFRLEAPFVTLFDWIDRLVGKPSAMERTGPAAFRKRYAVHRYNASGGELERETIRRALTPEIMGFLAGRPGLYIECLGGHLLMSRGKRLLAAEVAALLADALGLHRLLAASAGRMKDPG